MTTLMSTAPAYLVDPADVAALRDSLAQIAATGYAEASVRERLGLKDINDLQLQARPIYQARLAAGSPLDTAIDLFLLQSRVAAPALSPWLSAEAQDVLLRTAVLRPDDGGTVRANASLYPVGNRLFFSDHAWPQLSQPSRTAAPFDQVMFVGTDSRWLARATVRRPVARALDLCTGSGIQALLAAAHARQVVAVDINRRAVHCTRFNALAADCHNLDVAEGDLYGPVGGGPFDLITANPPFVPSPVDQLGFRDGGRSGEDIQRRIVAGVPEHLAPGGIAQVVTELGEQEGQPLVDRIRPWLGGAALDIHVLRLRTHSVEAYARGHAQGDTPEAFLKSVAAWADNLRAQGFERVVSVLLAFEWSDPACGAPWSRVDEAYPPQRESGLEIAAAFAAERLARDPDLRRKLEQGRLVRTGPVILHDGQVLGSDLPPTCQAILSGQGIPVEYALDPLERDLLHTLEQPLAVPTLLQAASQIEVSEATLYAALVGLLRKRLIRLA
jgi:hypothetical protein